MGRKARDAKSGNDASTMITSPSHLLLLGSVPFFFIGKWSVGLIFLFIGLTMMLCNAIDQIKEEEKLEIRYNILESVDVLADMKEQVQNEENEGERNNTSKTTKSEDNSTELTSDDLNRQRMVILTGLEALARKYGKRLSANSSRNKKTDHQSPASKRPMGINKDDVDEYNRAMELICQEAAYLGLQKRFLEHDEVIAASLSLLALVAKSVSVRERSLYEADKFGLDKPIKAMRLVLERAIAASDKDDDNNNNNNKDGPKQGYDEIKEQACAELQRKGCLMLGALADGDAEMARLVVDEGGLEAILDAIDWFRYHEDVANWALWAIFIISYENKYNKIALVQSKGVNTIIQAMRNCSESVDVARHAVAILFDLMRENDDDDENVVNSADKAAQKLDVWKIRSAAMAAGLHDVVADAIKDFPEAADVVMMGQELLMGTNYQGNIPGSSD